MKKTKQGGKKMGGKENERKDCFGREGGDIVNKKKGSAGTDEVKRKQRSLRSGRLVSLIWGGNYGLRQQRRGYPAGEKYGRPRETINKGVATHWGTEERD